MDERKWADSENMLRHATELNDHFAPSYFALGALLNEQHKPNEAIKTIEQGLKFEPNSWTGHVELCRSYFALNDVPNAKEHALRAHVLRPDSPVVHISLAMCTWLKAIMRWRGQSTSTSLKRRRKARWHPKYATRLRTSMP